MSYIQTVTGPIEPSALGVTSAHEHLLKDSSVIKQDPDARLHEPDVMRGEIEKYKQAGGQAMVELTCHGLNRDAAGLRELALATGLQVIAATGVYQRRFHPEWVDEMSVTALADFLEREAREGMDGTDVLPGVLGEIGTSHNVMHPAEIKVFEAAAEVHKRTGLPISTHCTLGTMAVEQLDLLERAGVDPGRVVLGHQDLRPDKDSHVALARRGAFIAYDTIGKESYQPDAVRVELIVHMLEQGLGEHVLLATDITRQSHLQQHGGRGYGFLLTNFAAQLRAAGVSDAELEQMLVHNPRRAFSIVK